MTHTEYSIQQLAEALAASIEVRDDLATGEIVQFLYRRATDLALIQEPLGLSPLQRAILAASIETLHKIWVARGIECQLPEWLAVGNTCGNDPFNVINPSLQSYFAGEPSSRIFAKYGIQAPENFLYFL